ncbi:twin-arginine translocation signal domain-containing protein [Ramlibacter sp. USB13]|uniref:Twin-arginine translocation signal domain-containing protein n=1 Tax=Ramlibacter cellulosilyticus TaxID=2764187 RepID=A0A923MNS3_9BURK|nr:twin-arginine translocation signal domain-containing protein [Ramlibacter cellulosilyticus]MBC5781814.1 twin-arginine translocation signal domain-containing protein [Ramlibacter cellulosilyticus]
MSESQAKPSRRGFVLGAAVAGAATAAVATLPKTVTPELPVAETTPPAPANGGGYRVSEHVKRYYKTTQV